MPSPSRPKRIDDLAKSTEHGAKILDAAEKFDWESLVGLDDENDAPQGDGPGKSNAAAARWKGFKAHRALVKQPGDEMEAAGATRPPLATVAEQDKRGGGAGDAEAPYTPASYLTDASYADKAARAAARSALEQTDDDDGEGEGASDDAPPPLPPFGWRGAAAWRRDWRLFSLPQLPPEWRVVWVENGRRYALVPPASDAVAPTGGGGGDEVDDVDIVVRRAAPAAPSSPRRAESGGGGGAPSMLCCNVDYESNDADDSGWWTRLGGRSAD